MEPLSIHKIQAINKYKKQQLVTNLVLYTLTALTCSLFCSSPLWYPPLRATVNVFLYISLPKISSLFFSSKVVFIVGNLIVIFLVGEFKIFTVPHEYSSPDYNDHEYVASSKILRSSNKKGEKLRNSSKERVKVNNYKDGGHQEINLRKEVARFKDCESKIEDSLFVGAMVGNLEPKGPSGVLAPPTQEDILLDSKEGNWRKEKTEDWKKKSDGEELSLPVKDLNKMADDFIARVNKQRRLEAEFCSIE